MLAYGNATVITDPKSFLAQVPVPFALYLSKSIKPILT